MGNGFGCCSFSSGSNDVSIVLLKERLEGYRRYLQDSPKVWVTIKELSLQGHETTRLCLDKFMVNGIRLVVLMEMVGSNRQIVQEIGSEAALKLIDKVSAVASSNSPETSEFTVKSDKPKALQLQTTSLIEVKEKKQWSDRVGISTGSWEKTVQKNTFELGVVINMSRELGSSQVNVEVVLVETHSPLFGTTQLHSDRICSYIEDIIANKVLDGQPPGHEEVGGKPT